MALTELSTFGAIVRQVQLLTGNRCDPIRAGEFVNLTLQTLWNDYSWSQAKVETTLTLVGAKQDGVVSLNLNPRLVEGWETGFTAGDAGSFLRVSSEVSFFRVTAVTGQRLTLEAPYPGASFVGQSYSLFRHLYALPADFRRFVSPTYWDHLSQVTQQQLDEWDPLRLRMDALPIAYAMRGLDRQQVRLVEVWPVPSVPVLIRYTYLKSLPHYGPRDGAVVIPLRGDLLTYMSAAEALFTLAAEERNAKSSGTLMSLAERWMAIGRTILEEAYRADRSVFGVPETVPQYGRTLEMGAYCAFLPVQPAPGQVITGDDRLIAISWVVVEVPISPLDGREILVSWVELEAPTGPVWIEISWVELQTPEPPARAIQISWVEVEVSAVMEPRQIYLSWVELETPPGPDRDIRVSWVEFEVPEVSAPRASWISWIELELPEGPDRDIRISWVEFEIPVPIDRRIQLSWVELELPPGPERTLNISWVEFEVPDVIAPRDLRISWVEFELPQGETRDLRISWVEFETT